MALPILDGNQSATTLSTILTGGAHIPAHTVVSLGAQAVSDITSAVSGISVSISGTQTTTFGAISGNVSVLNFPASQGVTFGATTGSVSVLNFPSTQTIAGTVTVGNFDFSATGQGGQFATKSVQVGFISDPNSDFYVAAGEDYPFPVNIRNSVSIGSLPAISGTVTANGGDGTFLVGGLRGGNKTAFPMDVGTGYLQTKIESMPSISGTVTVGGFASNVVTTGYTSGGLPVSSLPVIIMENGAGNIGTVDISGGSISVSGTVTVGNNPSGALTTRFGSVATANLAFITSAVTNTSRKYLLAQNISAGTVTIGIGFSPTTTQGIQLPAGGGLTFDAFCPTGAVYWLGAVTGAAFTILEG